MLVNGSLTEEFPMERRLRQGDPLSLFLFLLSAEGFNVLMESMNANHLLSGYKLAVRSRCQYPTFNLLMTLLF